MDSAEQADFVAWAKRTAIPLARIEDKGPVTAPADDADLTPLKAMIGDARIVGIGESAHHTHEFLALRERLVRYLVEQLGFDTLILEVLRPGANPIDDFAFAGKGTAEDALMTAAIRMWRNRETERIVEWVKAYNAARGTRPPVRIVGGDIVAPGESMRLVLDHLDLGAADKDRLTALSRGFDIDPRDDQIAYNTMSDEDRALLHATFEAALESLGRQGPGETRTAAQHEALLDQARVVVQALGAMRAGIVAWLKSFPVRDAAIGENLVRLVKTMPARSRAIYLANNGHVAATRMIGAEVIPAGVVLRRELGDDYRVIGGAFGEGRYDPPLYGVSSAPGEDRDSMDQLIAQLGQKALLLDIRATAADPAPAYVDTPRRMQSQGRAFHTAAPRAAYDVLAYIDLVTNADQLIVTEMNMDIAAVDASRPRAGD